MRVAIIGSGVAGLAAAWRLRRLRPEAQVTIYEQAARIGGRLSSGQRQGFIFDHGAQVIKGPSDAVLRLLERELPSAGLRRVELPTWVFDAAGRLAEGDAALNAEPAFAYEQGNAQLAALLAEGADVRYGVRVAALRPMGGGHALLDARGQLLGEAEAVVLTAPAPRAAELLRASQIAPEAQAALGAALAAASYRPCTSLALAYAAELARPFYGLINTDRRHSIAWLALEHAKAPGRCPPGHSLIMAQMSPSFSAQHAAASDADMVPLVAAMVEELLAEGLGEPLWADRRDWPVALPNAPADRAALLRWGEPLGLHFAGDYLHEKGRIHLVIESGWQAAEAIAARG
ncbi:FAD-dependent oxidoreductase [Chloroflexia bacterium SDU3-3]|nr:FAD-dependent oxidoreductase [Chloroflexia bacterium SDU3-3]